jgi:hypothetical protein
MHKLLKTLDFKAHFFNFLVRNVSFIFLADQNRKSCGPKMVRGPDFGKHRSTMIHDADTFFTFHQVTEIIMPTFPSDE